MRKTVKVFGRLSCSALIKTVAFIAAYAAVAFNFGGTMTELRSAPDAYFAESAADLYESISDSFSGGGLTAAAVNSSDETLANAVVEYKLFGVIPLRRVPAYLSERPKLTAGGQAVGISIYTDGILVVGTSVFASASSRYVSPAEKAGIRAGDVILAVNDMAVSSSDELKAFVDSGTSPLKVTVERNGTRFDVNVIPEESEYGDRRIGAWVRDSTVGIGTLSFYDAETGATASLGHAVADPDTGSLLKVKDGKLMLADIIGITEGKQGAPGELHGTFGPSSFCIGSIEVNTELGVFGRMNESAASVLGGELIETAFPDEVHTGDAYIISSADGELREYSCRIVKTGKQNEPAPKGIIIEITDDELIGLTGGIVQGMSGCPIIQDGRLVGVITHVFVNDPGKGYGAYAYWIYKRYGG